MSTNTAPLPEIHGFASKGFEAVRDAFVENFTQRNELGEPCCIYRHGEKVVDLWRVCRCAPIISIRFRVAIKTRNIPSNYPHAKHNEDPNFLSPSHCALLDAHPIPRYPHGSPNPTRSAIMTTNTPYSHEVHA